MKKAIIGKKVGMTQIFDESGKVIPVTVVEAGPCTVTQKVTLVMGNPCFQSQKSPTTKTSRACGAHTLNVYRIPSSSFVQ